MSRPVRPALSFCAPPADVLVVKEIIGKKEERNEENMKVEKKWQNNSMCTGSSHVAIAVGIDPVASSACVGSAPSSSVQSRPGHPV